MGRGITVINGIGVTGCWRTQLHGHGVRALGTDLPGVVHGVPGETQVPMDYIY